MADLIFAAARDVSAGVTAEGKPEVLDPRAQWCVYCGFWGL